MSALAVGLLLAAASFAPARLNSGALAIPIAPNAGPGEVWLELQVSETGAVTDVHTRRSTPPYTDPMREQVARWRFAPARESGKPVASRVLVVGLFRPPTLVGPGLGQAPTDESALSDDLPAPQRLDAPSYPARAVGDATVLLEMELASHGNIGRSRVLSGKSPFSAAARAAVRSWRFGRPARPTLVYAAVAFRSPVVER